MGMSARKWAVQVLVGLAVLAACAPGAPAQLFSTKPKPVATVDGAPVNMADVEAAMRLLGPSATPLTEAQQRQRQLEALDMVIDDLLLQQFLSKNGPAIKDADIDLKMREVVQILKSQSKSLEDFLKESGLTEAQLRSNILTKLAWDAWVGTHITEEGVKRYFTDNRDFFDRVTVRASHIEIRLPVTASDGEREAVRQKLKGLRQEIVSGAIDFAEAAKKYSQSESAAAGGDVGFFPRKFIVDESFAQAAFALKVGDVSDVVQTETGMHLIKVTERKAGQPADYEKVKGDVREFYIEDMRLAILAQQRKTAKIVINLP
jgi:parvulin-like peptidyl-prolyl isomerase